MGLTRPDKLNHITQNFKFIGEVVSNMIEFVVKYWIQWVFGLIAAGLSVFSRYTWKMCKKEQEKTRIEHETVLFNKI